MPQSKKRKSQVHAHQDFIPHKKQRKSIAPVAMVVCAILTLGITWFAVGASIPWLLGGVVLGIIVGYFAGKQMDKSFAK